jgi:hypothetical protein
MRADDNLLYKATLPPDIDDCSGRRESEKEGWCSAMANKAYSLSRTKWMCKYHIVFTPKYRRKAIYGQIRSDIGEIMRGLCEYKGVEIIEGHLMPDSRLFCSLPNESPAAVPRQFVTLSS